MWQHAREHATSQSNVALHRLSHIRGPLPQQTKEKIGKWISLKEMGAKKMRKDFPPKLHKKFIDNHFEGLSPKNYIT